MIFFSGCVGRSAFRTGQMDLWSTGIYTGTSTGTSTGSMTRGRSIGFGSRTDTALRSSLLSTISYLVRLAFSFLFLRCVLIRFPWETS